MHYVNRVNGLNRSLLIVNLIECPKKKKKNLKAIIRETPQK